jgi:hypothetical protein
MTVGPSFAEVTSRAHAEALAAQGILETVYLLPLEFGGQDIPQNIVYVPVGTANIKRDIDERMVGPLVANGSVTRYKATPAYEGKSFVPVSIIVAASDPGSFTTTINLWGPALA